MTASFVNAASATPKNTKTKAPEKIQRMRRQPAFLRVSDVLGPLESSLDMKLSLRFAAPADRRPCLAVGAEFLNSALSEADHYFAGSALDRSTVSSSGVVPAGTPFFCNKNAMMLIEFLAGTESGAIIGIVVCTADHSVEAFLPA